MIEDDELEMHKFWKKQPVVFHHQEVTEQGYIDETIPVTTPSESPLTLPKGFQWVTLDPDVPEQLEEIFDFLASNYVEDAKHEFRFLMTKELLKHALNCPGRIPEWIIGVRSLKGKIVGFITGLPQSIRHLEDIQTWCAVNFLCVHSILREKKHGFCFNWGTCAKSSSFESLSSSL